MTADHLISEEPVTPDVAVPETSRSRPRKTGRWTVVLAAAAGALAGFAAASLLDGPAEALASREVSAPQTATAWIATARGLREPGADHALERALSEALARDTTLFSAIVQEYGRTEQRPFRAALRDLIIGSARPDVLGAGIQLTREPTGLQRGAGFELLAGLPPTPERHTM